MDQLNAGAVEGLRIESAGTGNLLTIRDTTATAQDVLKIADGGATTLRNQTDSIAAFQVQSATAGISVLNVDTTNSQLAVRGINSNAARGGSNLFSGSCSGTNWSGATGPWTHTTGSTAALICTNPAAVVGSTYEITFTIASNTTSTNTVDPNMGGDTAINNLGANATHKVVVKATSPTALSFTPTTNFNGIISSIDVRLMTPTNSILSVLNSDATVALEVRSGGSGDFNTFVGLDSGRANVANGSNGVDNTALGTYALQSNTDGNGNTAIGSASLQSNTIGYNNSALGAGSLQANTTGFENAALGARALIANTTGSDNSAHGYAALQTNTTGLQNGAFGAYALQGNTRGNFNNAFGFSALYSSTVGTDNSAFGDNALQANTTGTDNTGVGSGALYSNQSGDSNTAIGSDSLRSTTGDGNVGIGLLAGQTTVSANANTVGDNNTFIGSNAGPGVTSATNLQKATAIGSNAVVSQNDSLVLGCISGTNGCAASTKVGIGVAAPLATLHVSSAA
ncbi:MAG TPA: hypothetical protein VMR98_00685, partial [Candidatus Polarisedimenticolaceae bacterium]|nr:hypothetical protein [Candidatus Polarisedimenticolaceae bacterium]